MGVEAMQGPHAVRAVQNRKRLSAAVDAVGGEARTGLRHGWVRRRVRFLFASEPGTGTLGHQGQGSLRKGVNCKVEATSSTHTNVQWTGRNRYRPSARAAVGKGSIIRSSSGPGGSGRQWCIHARDIAV